MEIKNVEKIENDGYVTFKVTYTNKDVLYVPAAPGNKDYRAVGEWYTLQEEKPFEFDFNL